ncbi:hypothetical protein [Methylobacterium sp. Leaf91]|uniref:hypothetical protein n=1 Tax=Methylobacterium sp. Leaf91 TaxID=1736247 RepID=UPI0006F8FCAE|nr:hypothetical protein [Methylobacterium sp. Leaf91]KQO99140.1 hypothetical protein ASF32_14900 [Methylobacterium sp. Leaf91]
MSAAGNAYNEGFKAGVSAMIEMALIAAITFEVRDDASEIRQRAAVAALQGLAEGAKAALIDPPNPLIRIFKIIADDPASSGVLPCPTCAGRLVWVRDSSNGHLHGQCETVGCLRWMQ